MIHQPALFTLFPELGRELQSLSSTGVFPSQMIREFVRAGRIRSDPPPDEVQIQPASIDLRLGPVAYRVQASFLPGRYTTVEKRLQDLEMCELDLTRPTVLERGCVYVVPLMEELHLPDGVYGKANPRSTVGRLDIFTRLLTDYGTEYERVPAGYKGRLYVEIVPRTFTILVRQGMRLNQLRLIRGNPMSGDRKLDQLDEREPLVYLGEDLPGTPLIDRGLRVCINLQARDGEAVIGYRARKNAPMLDLEQTDYYDPLDFWDPIHAPLRKGLILNPDEFYILASKEKVRIPPDHAAEMVAYDPAMGEFRIHYAGFFDPGFGYGLSDIKGTHAVLEVRSHEVPFVIEDGQIVGRLIYERLLEASDKIYGSAIGSAYQCQGLALSRPFRRMPAVS